MNDIARQALFGILVPIPIAALFALLGLRLGKTNREKLADLFFTLAIAVPMPVSFLILNGTPDESWERLVYLTVAGSAVGLVAGRTGRGQLPVGAVGLAIVVTAVLWPAVEPEESWVVRLTPGGACAVLFVLIQVPGRRVSGWLLALNLWLCAIATGLGVVLMGQMSMGAAVAPVGASLLVLALVLWRGNCDDRWAPGVSGAAAAVLASAPALAWMWMRVTGTNYGLWLALVPPMAITLLFIAPRSSGIPDPSCSHRFQWWRNIGATALVLLISLGAVAAMLILDTRSEQEDLPEFMQYQEDW